ncbi:MAG: hypothetical protein H8K07_01745 [Nitrospira sp.]|nr:hypothetical protein [Nitrospira sp.]
MPRSQVRNFSKGTVSIGYNAAATSIVLTTGDGAKFPSVFPYYCVWWNVTDFPDPADDPNAEMTRVDGRSTDTFTIARGQDGTSASTKNTASKTYRFMLVHCAALHNELYGNTQVFCGRFAYLGALVCRFDPYNGNRLLINGSIETIPSAGVSVDSGGLVSNTIYYAYMYMSSGVMTGEFSTTAPATDTTYGHQIKTGDGTRTLVGLVRTNASSQFVDSVTQRFVASRFNQAARNCFITVGTPTFTFTGTPSEIDNTKRVEWVQFSGAVQVQASGRCKNNTGGQTVVLGVRIDATTSQDGPLSGGHSSTANSEVATNPAHTQTFAAGYHFATVTGVVSANTGSVVSVVLSALLAGSD